MKKFAKIIALCIVIILATACAQNDVSKQQVKSLDSLSGALNVAAITLQINDSLALNKLLSVFDEYSQFMNAKLNDTLSREEAIDLKAFFESGEALKVCLQNNKNILLRLKTLNTQITRLSADIGNNAMAQKDAAEYFKNEIAEAASIIPLVSVQEKEYYANFQKLMQTTPKVEEIIKRSNNNQLPTIVPN